MEHESKNFINIGTATNHYADFSVDLDDDARLRHMFVLGQTGTGKSTLLHSMALKDMLAGNGFAFFDPHGDTVRELLDYIPASRMRDVVYLRPGDIKHSFGFNILSNVPPHERDRVTQEVVSTFRYRWFDSWGARMENIFKHTVRAILDAPARHGGSTLLSIPLMFNRPGYRKWILKHSTSPAVVEFFNHELGSWNARRLQEYVQPILNKVDQFLLSDTLRNVIGQSKSTIDLDFIMDRQRILLVDLDKGAIGADDANTIGSLLVTGFQLAAMRRSKIAPHERIPFYCYLDEFHSFTTGSFASILSESRKYGLGLVLAGQYIDQIEIDQVREAVFGNCGNLCCFRVSNKDASRLADTFDRSTHTIEDLPVGVALIKYLHDGHPRVYRMFTDMLPDDKYRGQARKVIEYSKRFTTPIQTISNRLTRWLKRIERQNGSHQPNPATRSAQRPRDSVRHAKT